MKRLRELMATAVVLAKMYNEELDKEYYCMLVGMRKTLDIMGYTFLIHMDDERPEHPIFKLEMARGENIEIYEFD